MPRRRPFTFGDSLGPSMRGHLTNTWMRPVRSNAAPSGPKAITLVSMTQTRSSNRMMGPLGMASSLELSRGTSRTCPIFNMSGSLRPLARRNCSTVRSYRFAILPKVSPDSTVTVSGPSSMTWVLPG